MSDAEMIVRLTEELKETQRKLTEAEENLYRSNKIVTEIGRPALAIAAVFVFSKSIFTTLQEWVHNPYETVAICASVWIFAKAYQAFMKGKV